MEENNFNNNPINNELPQQPVEPVTQNVQQPIVEPVQPVTPELQQPVEPVATVQPEPTVQPVVEPQMPVNNASVKDKKGGNNNFVICVLIVLVLALGGYLVYDKFFTKEVKQECKPTKETVAEGIYKIVDVESDKSETTYNGIKVATTAEYNKTEPSILWNDTSIKVNDVEVKDKVSIGLTSQYAIYGKYVIFITGNTSARQIAIYNTQDQSVKTYGSSELSYYLTYIDIDDSGITIVGTNTTTACQQFNCKTKKTSENAIIRIEYKDGIFQAPVDKGI